MTDLHPTGRCSCAGEGSCEWCTAIAPCGHQRTECPGCGAKPFADRIAAEQARAWASDGPLSSGRDELFAWVREWMHREMARVRGKRWINRDGQTVDAIDVAAALARKIGFTMGDGARIVPAIRLLKAALGSRWWC